MTDRLTPTLPLEAPTANNQPTTTPASPRYISRGPVRPGTILSSTPRQRDSFDRIVEYLRRLARERFYGVCAISLRDGAVELVRTEQTLKLGDIPTTATPGYTAIALGTTTVVDGGSR